MFKAVLFDLDNTLIDFMRFKEHAVEQAASAMCKAGLDMEPEEASKGIMETYRGFGFEDPEVFQKFLRKAGKEDDLKVIAAGAVAYRKVEVGFLNPYPHVEKTLMELHDRGKILGIVTDAPELKAWMRLWAMNIGHLFKAENVVTWDDTKEAKPSGLPFRRAIEEIGVEADEILFVGDSRARDVKGAKDAGMKAAWAKYGANNAEGPKPDYVLEDIEGLLEIVE